jgi:hypothetical protein
MKIALGIIEDRDDEISSADLLAREMNDAALRYARMAHQLDSVLRAARDARRDAWSRQRKASESGRSESAP